MQDLSQYKTLIGAWDAIMRPAGEPTRHLVGMINQRAECRYTTNRYLQWRRGERPIPNHVRSLMTRDVLQYALGEKIGKELARIISDGDLT